MCTLHVTADSGATTTEIAADSAGITFSPTMLSPLGEWHRWELLRNDGDFFSTAASGTFRALSPSEQARWELLSEGATPARRHVLQLSLGLWNDLFDELWPRFLSGETTSDECLVLHRVLVANCEWLMDHAPRPNPEFWSDFVMRPAGSGKKR